MHDNRFRLLLVCVKFCIVFVVFFKQKTAYEMRISDWSSDVCSSDLLSYEAIEVAADALVASLQRLHGDGYLGVNITLPHKAEVPMLCEMVSERALFAGAVNTLTRTEAGWYGDNTDGEGLARDLARLGDWTGVA